MMTTTLRAAVVMLLLQLTVSAQQAFDVASVRENNTGVGNKMQLMQGGGINAEHIPARFFISIAYDLKGFHSVGVPDWASDTYYDLIAKPAGTATRQQTFTMFQALLGDRFSLKFHRETRQVDGFALVQSKPGTLGPNLVKSAVDCEKAFASTPRCNEGGFEMSPTGTSIKAVGAHVWTLLEVIISQLEAPVIDDTRLSEPFDFNVQWSTDVAPAGDLPSIYTALQEQLGLKLEKRRVPVEMFIVERFERPTPD